MFLRMLFTSSSVTQIFENSSSCQTPVGHWLDLTMSRITSIESSSLKCRDNGIFSIIALKQGSYIYDVEITCLTDLFFRNLWV